MKLLAKLLNFEIKNRRKTLAEIEIIADAEYAKEQFQKLEKKGIKIPIALL